MSLNLTSFEYEGKIVDYGFYKGNLVFNLNSIGDMIEVTKPQMSIDTNDSSLVLKLTNESFASDLKEQILSTSKSISTYFRTLHNTGELFLTEAGLERFLSKSRKQDAKKLLEWMFTNIPKIKEQIMTNEVAQVVDNNTVFINNIPVVFMENNERILVSSRDVAAAFGKEHKNVLKIINELPRDEFSRLNFEPRNYIDNRGKVQPEYKMTRDGFSYIIMRFTGNEAHRWRIEFIQTFNKMEEALRQQHNHVYDDKAIEYLKAQAIVEEAKVRQAELNLKQAELNLKQAELNMDQLKLTTFSEIREYYKENKNDIGVRIYNNLITETLTGKPMISDIAVKVTNKLYSATEVGELVGISSRMVGIISNHYGLKTEEYGEFFWEKAARADKIVESFKYNSNGVEAIKRSYVLYMEKKNTSKKKL